MERQKEKESNNRARDKDRDRKIHIIEEELKLLGWGGGVGGGGILKNEAKSVFSFLERYMIKANKNVYERRKSERHTTTKRERGKERDRDRM